MELSRVREGDEIKCNVRGRVFEAVVEEKLPGQLRIKPLSRGITYFTVTARDVEKVLRKRP